MKQTALFGITKPEPDICRRKHGGASTSRSADLTVAKAKDRDLILGYIRAAGLYGHTLDELSILLDRPVNRISGRLTELRTRGQIVISDRVRKTRTGCQARVYVAFTL